MGAVTPVPLKAQYWSMMVEWAGYVSAYIGTNAGSALGHVYYDGQMCAYRVRDYTGDSAWDTYVQRAWYEYVPNYVVAFNGGSQGWRVYTNGPAEDVLRGTSRASQSLNGMTLLLQNAAYAAAGDMTPQNLSRECALNLISHIDYVRVGGTLTAGQVARRDYLFEKCLGHIDQWAINFTAPYFRPFMGAHTAKALIHYYEHVAADFRVVTKLKALAAHTRTTCWKAAAGTWGKGQSFSYTDRDTAAFPHSDPDYNSGGTETAPDLNIFVVPYFGWLWKVTGLQQYRDWGDEAWSGGVPVYDGPAAIAGAYLGTRSSANPSGKQYDQQLFWGPKYIEWAESTPVVVTDPNPRRRWRGRND